ncbi:MAG: DNA-3-methyladenine glycosylase [Caulobacterales bacterium 32-69-10]|nr:MAG: DNA-3-methyladenine glycosylase [Caulobacterales bacterium 32-69-10]
MAELPSPVCRCAWAGSDPLYCAYHDTEWGVPERDDRALWEKLVLDGFQAGLSWITILRKREAFREAFEGFDPEVIAGWGEPEIVRLLDNAGIIRSRAKIAATIGNARAYLAMQDKGEPFAQFIWSFSGGETIQNARASIKDVPAQTPMAVEMSKALKARGFKFCGPVITYAFLQATGVVNDHVTACFRWDEVRRMAGG